MLHKQKTLRIPGDMWGDIKEHKKRFEAQSEVPDDGPWLGHLKSDNETILDLIRLGIEAAKEMEIDSHIEAERKIGDPIYKSPELRVVETVYKDDEVNNHTKIKRESGLTPEDKPLAPHVPAGDAPKNVSPQTTTEKEGRKNTFSL
jgi:hypothetical protein